MKRLLWISGSILVLGLMGATLALGQQGYNFAWSTTEGTKGTIGNLSQGYALQGGQAESDVLSGGSYTLQAGFLQSSPVAGAGTPSIVPTTGAGTPSIVPTIVPTTGAGTPSIVPTTGAGTPSIVPTTGAGTPIPTNSSGVSPFPTRTPTKTLTPSQTPTNTPAPSATPTTLPSLIADVESVKSGGWNIASTWKDGKVPQASSVVKINAGHKVTLPPVSFTVKELQNEGTLVFLLIDSKTNKDVYLKANRAIYNSGEIQGEDGKDYTTSRATGTTGASVKLQAPLLKNEGTIRGGKGGDVGGGNGGKGGSVYVALDSFKNTAKAVVQAGQGGLSSFVKGKRGSGGAGGGVFCKPQVSFQMAWLNNALVQQELGSQSFVNEGTIQAGNGGAADDGGVAVGFQVAAAETAVAGDGGEIEINAANIVNASLAKIQSGDGGEVTSGLAPGASLTKGLHRGSGRGGRGGSAYSKGGSIKTFTLSGLVEEEIGTDSLSNDGTFQSGSGGASAEAGGEGGDLSIAANEVKNATQGVIGTGNGGLIEPSAASMAASLSKARLTGLDSGRGGRGGLYKQSGGTSISTSLTGQIFQEAETASQTFINAGRIKAGSGGEVVITGTLLAQTDTLLETKSGNGGEISIAANNLTNKGQVQAGDGGGGGQGGSGGNLRVKGSSSGKLVATFSGPTWLTQDTSSTTLNNEGTIQSGSGGSGDIDGGNGGGFELSVAQINNASKGQLASGDGGDVSGTSLAYRSSCKRSTSALASADQLAAGSGAFLAGIHSGRGCSGNASVRSNGQVSSSGGISTGRNLPVRLAANLTASTAGSDEGILQIIAPDLALSGSKISGNGEVRLTGVAPSSSLQQTAGGINLSGSATVIEGGSIEVSAGPGMSINLDDMAPGAINSAAGVTIAAGPGGSVSMQGSTGVISATKVTLAADKVETGGVDLSAVVGNNVEQLPAQVLGHVSFSQPAALQTAPGQAVTTTLTLYNDSPNQNTYTFTVAMDNPSWTLTGLPSTQGISGFASADLQLILNPPSIATAGETAVITLTSQAKENPNLVTSTFLNVALEVPATNPAEVEPVPTPTPTNVYTPADTLTKKVYLPLVKK